MGKKKYYAVVRGKQPGIYSEWFGPTGAEPQIRGFAGAIYRGFPTLAEARQWFSDPQAPPRTHLEPGPAAPRPSAGQSVAYTDGACRGNPGPGGYGVVILEEKGRQQFSQGYRLTTNNRMELMACIAALKTLAEGREVLLHSDSRYVVQGIEKGLARKWQANKWMRTKTEPAQNSDLWEALLALCDRRRVTFRWVRGHAGQAEAENERCDTLATEAAQAQEALEDKGYPGG
ncbi:MAG: ribonuclease HI [Syntrophaceae bacterium]|nr:ribonuclease HI [Syntrophaceae bacterium]